MSHEEQRTLPDSASRTQTGAPSLSYVDLGLACIAIIWGTNFVVIKVAITQFLPLVFTSLRFLIGAISLLAILLLSRQSISFSSAERRHVLALAAIGHIIFQVLFVLGLKHTTAANSSLIIACSPALVASISHILRWERLKFLAWSGVALSLTGISLVIAGTERGISFGMRTFVGDFLTAGAMVCWAIYTTMIRPLVNSRSSLVLTASTLSIGSIGLLAVAIPSFRVQNWSAITVNGWGGLAYSGFVVIGLGYLVWGKGVQKNGGARTSLYSNLITIAAIAAGILFLDEHFSFLQVVGAALVFLGTGLTRLR